MAQVLAMGTKSIPGFAGELSTAWDTSASAASTTSTPATPTAGGEALALEVHMGEAPRVREREDDDR